VWDGVAEEEGLVGSLRLLLLFEGEVEEVLLVLGGRLELSVIEDVGWRSMIGCWWWS